MEELSQHLPWVNDGVPEVDVVLIQPNGVSNGRI